MTVKRYRKKPVVIEALELTPEITLQSVRDFCPSARFYGKITDNLTRMTPVGQIGLPTGQIPTLEGIMAAGIGDWIIKGVKGEFYPIKSDIFHATYELVSDESPSGVPEDCPTQNPGVHPDCCYPDAQERI